MTFLIQISVLITTLLLLPHVVKSLVPPSNTFKYINNGFTAINVVEYDPFFAPLPLSNSIFALCFYNTTPNAYTLGLLMGNTSIDLEAYWVWEANRGDPVREKSSLALGRDGNLVLADADGRIVWQTRTANKGVVGFKVLPNGNMVLYDGKGKFVWQSFDSATDTLLMGQSLRLGGPTRLVSRASAKVSANGAYSMVMDPKGWTLYYTSPTYRRPLPYYYQELIGTFADRLEWINFTKLETMEGPSMELRLAYKEIDRPAGAAVVLTKVKHNATLSYLRLGMDGNVRANTFDPNTRFYGAWDVTYTHFTRSQFGPSECELPERCGSFGICSDNQCVGCPTPKGITGWSAKCHPEKISGCGSKDFVYYKVVGVEHFSCKHTPGMAVIEDKCSKMCSGDCKCLAYFYNRKTSRCWTVYDLKTLRDVGNANHVAFIKAPNRR